MNNHENVLNMLHFHQQELKQFCSHQYVTFCVFEYCPRDFLTEWKERAGKR